MGRFFRNFFNEDWKSDTDFKNGVRDVFPNVNGRAFYNNVDEAFALTTDTPVRIQKTGGLYSLAKDDNVTLVNDRLVAGNSGRMLISGMISFQGYNGGSFKLQLRKNDEIVCICNPLIQTQATRVVNLVSTDYAEFEEGDTLSLWIVDQGNGGTIQLKTSKIILINI